jgi:predicted nucleic acid-binding protein
VVSTEAVLTEATHLLAGVQGGRAACVDFFLSGGALLVPSSQASLQRVRRLLDKYADLPMDFADATLVALAEELDCVSVFTTDRTDFSVYRLKGRKSFRILPNDGVVQDNLLAPSPTGRHQRHCVMPGARGCRRAPGQQYDTRAAALVHHPRPGGSAIHRDRIAFW